MSSNTPRLSGRLPRHIARAAQRDTTAALAMLPDLASHTDSGLADTYAEIAARHRAGDVARDDRAMVAALCSEAAARTVGHRMHPNQVLAGLAIASGCVAEMATGEGKTLAVTTPAAWFALAGLGVHVATANDYLAARDAAWMAPVFELLGLTATHVDPSMTGVQRRAAYTSDVVYGTAAQFGFDHLRDHLALDPDEVTQRGHHAVIVDEADALLIDEAKTPLIVSGPGERREADWARFAAFAAELTDKQYEVRADEHVAVLSDEGVDAAQEYFGVDNLYTEPLLVHHIAAALTAELLYERDRDYIVAPVDGVDRVLLIDEHTGRTLSDRRLQDSIHEALEAAEGLEVAASTSTHASISLQALFAGYTHVAGTSGTAASDHEELERTYGTPVAVVPTHRPVARVDEPDLVYATREDKMAAIAAIVAERSAAGQPVLVGAPTVADAEDVSEHLRSSGIDHEVLSARNPAREAFIVAQAGRPGQVTVATNMAGRGVDIRLGGNPEALAAAEVAERSEVLDDAAVAAEGLDIDDVLSGEDSDRYHEALERWSQRCSADREKVLAAGGLFVLGTSRHSSRRIDDQLRGRSGRQGEPGESRFYLSLTDPLIETFAGPAAAALLTRVMPAPGEPVRSKMLSKVIATAQDRQEQFHRDQRDTLGRYDSVNTILRNRFYEWRDQALHATFEDLVTQWFSAASDVVVDAIAVDGDMSTASRDDVVAEFGRLLPSGIPSTLLEAQDPAAAAEIVVDAALTDLRDRYSAAPDFARDATVRTVLLNVADGAWRTFLDECDSLRSGIHLRQSAGRNPQMEYATEANRRYNELFDEMVLQATEKLMALYVRSVEERAPTGSDGSQVVRTH